MVTSKSSSFILLLRAIHGLFALYFISCIFYIYYSAITVQLTFLLGVAILSLLIEGIMVFVVNGGDCPLIYFQRKINDPVPFFNLFLPDYLAKKAIPFFSFLMVAGMLLLIVRIWLR